VLKRLDRPVHFDGPPIKIILTGLTYILKGYFRFNFMLDQ